MFTYRMTSYKNGNLDYVIDSSRNFDTREDAVASAQYEAEYWHLCGHNDSEILFTEDGAKRWAKDTEGNRYYKIYEVVSC